MKLTRAMKFDRVAGFYPDLQGLVPEDAQFERKVVSDVEIKAMEGGGYEAILTTTSVDRDGDIILSHGINIDYYTGTTLWNHNLDGLPIGKCLDIVIQPDMAYGRLVFAQEYDFAEDVESLVRQGMLRGISIGYIPKKVAKRGTTEFNRLAAEFKLDTDGCERILYAVELVEVSVVPVGCNREAMIYAIASKAFTPSETGEKNLGLDDSNTRMLITLERKVLDLESKMAEGLPDEQPAEPPASQEPPAEPQEPDIPVAEPPADHVPETPPEPVPEPVPETVPEPVPETVPVPEPAPEPEPVPEPKKAIEFTLIREGGYVLDTKAVSAMAADIVSGKLV